MTLLGILFVLGVAFLGTMNFEASMIAAETTRSRGQDGVKGVAENVGSMMRDGVMFSGTTPFGGGALSSNSFAELPGVQNLSSPIEPYRFDNGTPTNLSDDVVRFPYFTNLEAIKSLKSTPPIYPGLVPINAVDFDGDPTNDLFPGITVDLDGDGILETVVDSDGDGIVDSVQVEASVLKLSAAQMSELSARLNPASNPGGKVFVGVRVIPHTGLVNLNQSHPYLLRDTLGLPSWPAPGDPPDPNLGRFVHAPTQSQTLYTPSQDEAVIRHRGMLLPRQMTPSRLLGDPSLDQSANPTGLADMQWQLFDPKNAANDEYWSVFERIGRDPRRYWNYRPDEYWADNPDNPPTWAVRMEPTSTALVDPSGVEYDRRHLVTTISHDDLLTRGGRVPIGVTVPQPPPPPAAPYPPITQTDDILAAMRDANLSMWDPSNPSAIPRVRPLVVSYPFEYADYPQTIVNPPNSAGEPCLASDPNCKTNPRKGRLQLSLAWLDSVFSDDGNDTNDSLPKVARDRLIYDAFFMLVNNASGAYWEEVPCTPGGNQCPAFEECRDIAGTPPVGICRDRVTNQRHRANLITRTAAALTANMLDFADLECLNGARDAQTCRFNTDCPGGTCVDRAIPTRVALRSFDFAHPVCITRNGQELIAPVTECTLGSTGPSPCPGGYDCVAAAKSVGREFDADPLPDRYSGPTDNYNPVYVYGIEKQPYITEVATVAVQVPPDPPTLEGRAIEIFNPYGATIDTLNQYFLSEVDPGGTRHDVPLTVPLQPAGATPPGPFTVLISGSNVAQFGALATANGTVHDLGAGTLQFKNGWRIYLVKRVHYPDNAVGVDTEIVVDQITVEGQHLGKDGLELAGTTADCTTAANCIFSAQRLVQATLPWTATVPFNPEGTGTTLGDWNTGLLGRDGIHPVEIRLANFGTFTRPFSNPPNPLDPSVAFPTTGSLLVLPRHANRSLSDLLPPYQVTDLAFTTGQDDHTDVPIAGGGMLPLFERDQIDNGRMPVFDPPTPNGGNFYAAHHDVPPVGSTLPGDLNQLPWGQLVFDYFTALPLSNAGPYLVNDINLIGLPDSQPRVDLEGLRVHGRINVNAAPATVMAGLPFVPLQKVPVDFRARMRRDLGFVKETSLTPLNPLPADVLVFDNLAGRLGSELADAVVAYRELRPLPSAGTNLSGNYNTGLPEVIPVVGQPPVRYGRGLGMTAPNPPLVRRGSGIMSIGELANVRHLGAAATGFPPGFPQSFYRFDGGVVDAVPTDNNTENFIDAIATLYALGDWVTVRSQVFTVYGVLRGENDPSIGAGDPLQAQMQAQDVDSRAIRFQETIDRLPTVLGEPLPTRIGQRSVGRYTDVRND